MARTPLYSRSPRMASPPSAGPDAPAEAPEGTSGAAAPSLPAPRRARLRAWLAAHERWLWATGALLLALLAGWPAWHGKTMRPLTMEQIDAGLRESIAKEPLASAAAGAYEAVLPSVVRVVGERASDKPARGTARGAAPRDKPAPDAQADADGDEAERGRSVGSGVVIVDRGLILTNLHVVAGAQQIKVTFWNGHESEASVVNLQPEHDLAVLQAKSIPDDLQAATMRSTSGLAPGDGVIAVGFPFGIGPSVSSGVVSGLKREFRSPEGKRILTNLIQFDAAANPGNSGGPLVTMDGHVVGIVTAIMNPNEQRTFIGIGFAVPIENAAAAAGLPPF
jgi:S1-C subfamily serine protease